MAVSGSSPLTRGKLRVGSRLVMRERLIPAHAGKTSCAHTPTGHPPAHPRSRGENAPAPDRRTAGEGSSPLTRGKLSGVMHSVGGFRLIPAHAGKTGSAPRLPVIVAAHPRSRGENSPSRIPPCSHTGSSPLTRGKQATWRPGQYRLWLIPAHAGKTLRSRRLEKLAAAHPRSRGENVFASGSAKNVPGSSPLTRGKRRRRVSRPRSGRLIPAHAGKTPSRSSARPGNAAHPRSRGENLIKRVSKDPPSGSSPLTRGKRLQSDPFVTSVRLIPAHAGKTRGPLTAQARSWAHPRSRGENVRNEAHQSINRGSSPLTRGKPLNHGLQRLVHGLIPAHAGKTGRARNRRAGRSAHPRSRGENDTPFARAVTHAGSSPLTRGKRGSGLRLRASARLIPAHAGKTSAAPPAPWRGSAHPRSRGENLRAAGLRAVVVGSSPLTRGKRARGAGHRSLRRLIPAHAGKTMRPASRSQTTTAHPRSRGENMALR